jgi:hypothetical protein
MVQPPLLVIFKPGALHTVHRATSKALGCIDSNGALGLNGNVNPSGVKCPFFDNEFFQGHKKAGNRPVYGLLP